MSGPAAPAANPRAPSFAYLIIVLLLAQALGVGAVVDRVAERAQAGAVEVSLAKAAGVRNIVEFPDLASLLAWLRSNLGADTGRRRVLFDEEPDFAALLNEAAFARAQSRIQLLSQWILCKRVGRDETLRAILQRRDQNSCTPLPARIIHLRKKFAAHQATFST